MAPTYEQDEVCASPFCAVERRQDGGLEPHLCKNIQTVQEMECVAQALRLCPYDSTVSLKTLQRNAGAVRAKGRWSSLNAREDSLLFLCLPCVMCVCLQTKALQWSRWALARR